MIIDVHHHWMPEKQFHNLDKMMRKGESVTHDQWGVAHLWRKGIHVTAPGPIWYNLEKHIEDMDAAGIDMAVLSLAGTHEWTTSRTAPFINECVAEAVGKYPSRFVGLCHVSLVGKVSLKEMERAIKGLGLRGVNITTHIGYQGTPADAEVYWPFWEKVADMEIPVAVQPYGYPAESKPLTGFPILSTLVRLDNALRFMMRIVHGKLLDRFPTLRILCPHLGAGYFAVMSRMAPGLRAFLSGEIPFEQLDERQRQEKERIARHMAQIYVDTAYPVWEYPELACALEKYGADKLVFGTDYPVAPHFMQKGVSLIQGMKCTKQEKKMILGQTAADLFNIPLQTVA